jgi:multicomponent Na+:H+ antiporter subunit D
LLPLALIAVSNLMPRRAAFVLTFVLALAMAAIQVALAAFYPDALLNASGDGLASYLGLTLSCDNLSLVMFVAIGLVAFVVLLVGRDMLDGMERLNFMNLVLAAMIGMNAIVMLADVFSLYVFIELVAVASFILIAIQKGKLALEGTFKYIMLSAIATVLMLSGVAFIVIVAGGTSFDAVKEGLSNPLNGFFVKVAIGLFMSGLFIKSGLVPFHGWLPDAYSAAPAPVSVFLAGIVTKASGVYVLIRMFVSAFGADATMQNVLMIVGVASIVVGAFAAMWQGDFKRMLAYSSISQVGYIILALGCATPLAIAGAVFHLFNHAIFKSLLFVNSAAIEKRFGTTDMANIDASGMTLTATTSTIGFLSTAGVPPLAGFWSKIMIIMALWMSGMHAYAIAALLTSLVTLSYFLLMQRKLFFRKASPGAAPVKGVFSGIAVAETLLASLTVAIGLFSPFVLEKFILRVADILR